MSRKHAANRFPLAVLLLLTLVCAAAGWDQYVIDLPSDSRESLWRDALAKQLGGKTEVSIEGGRIDVLTDALAIEVDFPHKWHEGLGQALHYADATGKTGAVALISYSRDPDNMRQRSVMRLEMVESIYRKNGVKLIVLFPSLPREDQQKLEADGAARQNKEGEPRFQHWLNSRTGVRHSSDCQFFENTQEGYHCGPEEGRACSICGG